MSTSRQPKTPPSSRQLGSRHSYDPDITPTRRRIQAGHPYLFTRQKSWEEALDPIASLADPRELNSLAFNEIWRGDYVQDAKAAFVHFHNNLKLEFRQRRKDYKRMRKALDARDERG